MVEINRDLQSNDEEDWAIATMRLMRAAMKNGNRSLLNGVKQRVVAKHGDILGEAVFKNLEELFVEEIMDNILDRHKADLAQ